MPKDHPNMHVLQNKNWCNPKSDWWFFFLTLPVGGPFHKKGFKKKMYGGMGLISEKREALCAKRNQWVEAAASSYSATADFLQ